MKLKKFKSLFSKCDLFAEPVSLTFKGSRKIATKLGAIFTFFLLSSIIFISNSKLESILNRTTVYIQSFPSTNEIPPEIDLKSKFAIYFDNAELSAITGKRYFDFTFEIGNITFLDNGTSKSKVKFLKLMKCEVSYFPMFKEQDLKKAGIDKWICPDYSNNQTEWLVKGAFGNPEYIYFNIKVKKCSNQTNPDKNSSCVSDNEFLSMRKKIKKIYLDLVLINDLLDLNDFEKPFKPRIEIKSFFLEPNKTFSQYEYFFQKTTVSSDLTQTFNALRSESNYENQISPLFNGKIDNFFMTDITFVGDVYATIILRSDQNSQKYVRKYDCFQDYLQSLGSFYSVFFLIFSAFNSYFSRHFKTKQFAESFYNFNEDEDKPQKQGINRTPSTNLFERSKRFIKECFLVIINRAKIHNYPSDMVRKHIFYDLDITNILINLKILNNLKEISLRENQKLVLNMTGREKFEYFILKERKSMLKSRISEKYFQEKQKEKRRSLLKKIDDSLNELKRDFKNEISKKIWVIFHKNNMSTISFSNFQADSAKNQSLPNRSLVYLKKINI